jgi:hypothetical protein
MVSKSWSRRGVLAGAGALAGCAATSGPLPGYVFSLTVWASGDTVDFLLLNVADNPVAVINPVPRQLAVEIKDDMGASLTDGFVPLFEDAPPLDLSPRRARKLLSQKAAKGSMSARQLTQALAGRVSFDPARIYSFGFEVQAPVVSASNQVLLAHVRTRSLCDLSFRDSRARMDCRSPY